MRRSAFAVWSIEFRRAIRGDAGGGPRIRLPARGLWSVLGIRVWVDADVGRKERVDCDAGGRFRASPVVFSAATENSLGRDPASDRCKRQAARDYVWPTGGHRDDRFSRDGELLRRKGRG